MGSDEVDCLVSNFLFFMGFFYFILFFIFILYSWSFCMIDVDVHVYV